MAKKWIYAVEVRLLEIEADLDDYGKRIPGTPKSERSLANHYDGSMERKGAERTYDMLSELLRGARP